MNLTLENGEKIERYTCQCGYIVKVTLIKVKLNKSDSHEREVNTCEKARLRKVIEIEV